MNTEISSLLESPFLSLSPITPSLPKSINKQNYFVLNKKILKIDDPDLLVLGETINDNKNKFSYPNVKNKLLRKYLSINNITIYKFLCMINASK